MPDIVCELRDFANRSLASPHMVTVTPERLLDCAARVGMPTIASHPAHRRPFAEMLWRMGMVAANLRPTKSGKGWTRTSAYNRLDPSEKSAVSYFLGMTQAALTTRYVLGYPHLVHVDLLLRHQGLTLSGHRPDFVAVDPASSLRNAYSAVVEAKGRTNSFDEGPLDRAKAQVATTSTIRNLHVRERIASVAYFDEDDHWASVLKDPDGSGEALALGLESYLLLYYRNIIEAGRESETWELTNGSYSFVVRDFRMEFQIPKSLVDAYDESAGIASSEDRDAEAPILANFYRLAESSSDDAGDLIVSRFLGDSEEVLSELLELYSEG